MITMKPETYFIGDLSLVLTKLQWKDVLAKINYSDAVNKVTLESGIEIAVMFTNEAGRFFDNLGGAYIVIEGNIGCVKVSDLDMLEKELLKFGTIASFKTEFELYDYSHTLTFGKLEINTNFEDYECVIENINVDVELQLRMMRMV